MPPGTPVIVTGLGYGDEGKGGTVDWLCSTGSYDLVVRHNGGAQAAHHVVREDGTWHRFAQWGSGTFRSVPTHLSKYMLVHPDAMLEEGKVLAEKGVTRPFDLVTVSPDALMLTPWHAEANRSRELARGEGRHGSCGLGIGEAMAYLELNAPAAPRIRDVLSPSTLGIKLELLDAWLHDEFENAPDLDIDAWLQTCMTFARQVRITDWPMIYALGTGRPVIFEGAQGVLLDERWGWHPHTTWSRTTPTNARQILEDLWTEGTVTEQIKPYVLGVLRSYTTRHGNGPHVTELGVLPTTYPELHNGWGEWMGDWRVGGFDAVAHRYAIAACGQVDGLMVTHCDRPIAPWCESWRLPITGATYTPEPRSTLDNQELQTHVIRMCRPVYDGHTTVDRIEAELGVQVVAESHGPMASDKLVRQKVGV